MSTTFELARVGDRVWSITRGWGEITKIENHSNYPITVKYDSTGCDTFTFDGYLFDTSRMRSLFWDEVVIDAPAKPMSKLEVDSKILVWNDPEEKHKQHFSHFDEYGYIYTFTDGKTSFTSQGTEVSKWLDWDFAE